ncbi:hypothetical protein ACVU7I_18040, partial [Patulibacter sp. S7RM1-6]
LAEHRERPWGPHSPGLVEVLDFVRRNPDPERPRYLVLDLGGAFAVGRRGPTPGAPPDRVDAVTHPTREAAEHAVFLRRLRDYGVAA